MRALYKGIRWATVAGALLFLLIVSAGPAGAEPPRALPPGKQPADHRLGELRTLNSYFPFTPVDSAGAWAKRAERLRRQVRLATGLWPWPTRTPLNPVIHGKVDRGEYTVEKVYFESFPGHYVTGNLYRPLGRGGKRPAVLCPHGHWRDGRFYDHGPRRVRQQIAIGAERFEVGGRYPLQARCVQLARMGCVVFHYDMVGYADSVQLQHRPGVRQSMNTAKDWGFFSPQAELRLQTMMGLQTWNSVRALDFLLSLPDVDPKRVAVTGASGGGTQTFIIGAVDLRPAVLVPCVMVSTAMQGGCTCENASYLRIGAGNIDIAALAAPRPLGLTAADDWTKELATKGLPDLENLYETLGVPKLVDAGIFTHFKHNYNAVSRVFMYNWLNRHLKLGFSEPVIERDYVPLSRDEMSVWDSSHPKPSGDQVGDAHERALLRWMTADSDKHIQALLPTDAASLAEFRRLVGAAFDIIIGRRLDELPNVEYKQTNELDKGSCLLQTGLVTLPDRHEQLPTLRLVPKQGWNKQTVVWIHEAGKSGLVNEQGEPVSQVARLLQAGYAVVSADLLYQGEFLKDGKPLRYQRLVATRSGKEPWHQYAGYTFGYNYPLFCQRVHDTLSVLKSVVSGELKPAAVHLVGLGATAGPLVAAARAQSGGAVARTAVDTGGFRFARLDRFDDPMFVPGAVKYLDLPGIMALCAPGRLWLAGEGEAAPPPVAAAYRASGHADRLTVYAGDRPAAEAAVDWLIGQ